MLRTLLLVILPAIVQSTAAPADRGWEDRCNGTWTPPATIVNTTLRLAALRQQMIEYNISAYIITSNDEHQSEYVAEHDKRRAYISGFSGSAGDAVVTLDQAALWTDSRYYIQAADQLDCNWLLMPTGEAGTPSVVTWLATVLPSQAIVSADPKTSPFKEWEQWRTSLDSQNITLMVTTENLVDAVWGDDQPAYPDEPLMVLGIEHAGVAWQEKLALLRADIRAKNLDTIILTALDEIAWTLNLRGGDVPFTPVFRSYLVIQHNKTTLYLPSDKVTELVEAHLNSNGSEGEEAVRIKDYQDIWADLEQIGLESNGIALPTQYSYALGVSYLIHAMLPAEKITDLTSPALTRKDTKNEVEALGMRSAHIKDGVALSVFFARLSEAIAAGDTTWTELSAVAALDALRWQQPDSRGPSFETIAAVGVNAALPHYEPSNATDRPITGHELFLVDSGGQYLDGTTDVTRTVHFGVPRAEEIMVYTKLLMGCIDLVTVLFPESKTGNDLEILVRRPLYSLGMDFGHGTTHGIGSMLSVHEAFSTTYHVNFFGSQEPGYYKEGDYGMRLENIVSVVRANPMSGAENYLTFDTITMAPYERKLINTTLLEKKHISWVNDYHETVRKLVGDEMLRQGYQKEHSWLLQQTEPISDQN